MIQEIYIIDDDETSVLVFRELFKNDTEYKFIRNNGNIILDKYNTYAETNNKDTRKFVHILSK